MGALLDDDDEIMKEDVIGILGNRQWHRSLDTYLCSFALTNPVLWGISVHPVVWRQCTCTTSNKPTANCGLVLN